MNQLQTSLKKNALLVLRSPELSSRALAPMSVILVEKLHSRPNIRHASAMPTQRKDKKHPYLVPKKNDQVLRYQPITLLSKSLLTPMNSASLHLTPIKYSRVQKRSFSSESVMDEGTFDCMLHERELAMLRHPAGPIKRMSKLSRDALKGLTYGVKLLDLDSKPSDLPLCLAKEFPSANLHSLSTSPEALQFMADGALKSNLPNISTHLSNSEMFDLKDLDDNSYDLVTSCFGLQKSSDPQKTIQEIHR